MEATVRIHRPTTKEETELRKDQMKQATLSFYKEVKKNEKNCIKNH